MSSKNNEYQGVKSDVSRKKKHKHKVYQIDDKSLRKKGNKHRTSINLENESNIKHHSYKQTDPVVDPFDEIKVKASNNQRRERKQKSNFAVAEEVMPTSVKSPHINKKSVLSWNDNRERDELPEIKISLKSDCKLTEEQKSNKVKQKIYSSSENEDENSVPKKNSPLKETKIATPSENYFGGWSKEDVVQLISRMFAALPKNDKLKYVSRVEKLNWEEISFGKYTATECKEKWKTIEKKIRGYRILQEVLRDAEIWTEQPWTNFYRSSKKKNRHPDMPKKPLTSYMIFYMRKKAKIIKENPGIALTTLSKVIADKFNKLSPKKKAKYSKLSDVMKEKYKEDLQKFYLDHPSEGEKVNASKNKKKKETGRMPGPAKPVPPLKLFIEDKIKQHKDEEDFNQALLIQQCKEKWKTMSSRKKIPWIRWAHEAEMKYLEEIKSYQAENPSFEMPKHKSVLSKEEKTVLERMEGKPEKPPGSAYGLFSKLMLKNPDLRVKCTTPKERMQEIAKIWKDAPKLEKDGYAEQLKHLLAKYKLEYASYLESLPEDKREEELANSLPKRKAKTVETDKYLQKKLKIEKQTLKKETNEKMLLEELFAKEPKAPDFTAFDLFQKEMVHKGLSSKKIKKAWKEATQSVKQKYEMKLEALRQKYIADYKNFLTNLEPEILHVYCQARNKLEYQPTEIESQISDESCNGSGAEEKKVNIRNNKDTSPSASSASSSSSSSSASSSSENEVEIIDYPAVEEEDDEYVF